MIDHLMRYASEADAIACQAAGAYHVAGQWRPDVCIPHVAVYRVVGSEMVNDGEGGEIEREVREPYSGWYLVIALPAPSGSLRDVPGHACRLITDRDASAQGASFVRYAAPDLAPQDMAEACVEPTFAGSRYPFGAVA